MSRKVLCINTFDFLKHLIMLNSIKPNANISSFLDMIHVALRKPAIDSKELDLEGHTNKVHLVRNSGVVVSLSTRNIWDSLNIQTTLFEDSKDCENDPSYLQIVPYITLFYNSGGERFVLKYKRDASKHESKVHVKHSLGFGSYIEDLPAENNNSFYLFDTILRTAQREVVEETDIFIKDAILKVALLYASNFLFEVSNTGRFHLGISAGIISTESFGLAIEGQQEANRPDMEEEIVSNLQWAKLTSTTLMDYNWEAWSRKVIQEFDFSCQLNT